jgi:hypothetical protein
VQEGERGEETNAGAEQPVVAAEPEDANGAEASEVPETGDSPSSKEETDLAKTDLAKTAGAEVKNRLNKGWKLASDKAKAVTAMQGLSKGGSFVQDQGRIVDKIVDEMLDEIEDEFKEEDVENIAKVEKVENGKVKARWQKSATKASAVQNFARQRSAPKAAEPTEEETIDLGPGGVSDIMKPLWEKYALETLKPDEFAGANYSPLIGLIGGMFPKGKGKVVFLAR